MKHSLRILAIAAATLAAGTNAHAVTDAAGDFLPSYTGSQAGAYDILVADVSFDPGSATFSLHAKTAGDIASRVNAAYVFGFNRGGTANSPFGAIGVPDVSFNATAVMRSNGTGSVGANSFAVNVVGDEIFGTLSASLLPSNGATPDQYTWSLWSINSAITGLPRNADFAPTSNIAVAVVPEPETYALMLAGLGAVGVVARRRSMRR
jgi:hypothetical protein